MTEQSQTVRELARSADEISTVSADNALAARRLSNMAAAGITDLSTTTSTLPLAAK